MFHFVHMNEVILLFSTLFSVYMLLFLALYLLWDLGKVLEGQWF